MTVFGNEQKKGLSDAQIQVRLDRFLARSKDTGINAKHAVRMIRWDSNGNLVTWEASDNMHRIYNNVQRDVYELLRVCEERQMWDKMQEILQRHKWKRHTVKWLRKQKLI